MNITKIRLINFHGFKDATIELKPLTVLIGPNSAGKSSFGQALAALSHTHKTFRNTPQANLTPTSARQAESWPVDLGLSNDLRTDGEDGPVKIQLDTREGPVVLGFGGLSKTPNLDISYISHPLFEDTTTIDGHSISVPEIATASKNDFTSTVSNSSSFDAVVTTPTQTRFVELVKKDDQSWYHNDSKSQIILDGLIVKSIQHVLGSTPQNLGNIAMQSLDTFLTDITYLRANRKRPSRGYESGEADAQPIGYSGEWAPSIFHMESENKRMVTLTIPPLVPTSTTEARQASRAWGNKKSTLQDAVSFWLQHIGIANKIRTEKRKEKTLKDISVKVAITDEFSHDLTEVGFGISQFFPVLLAGLLQPENSLFIVDLPEAHLHPRPQGLIADYFCSLAKSKRNVLIESHSEMFFHRLRLRAIQDPSLMENIAVYFIDEPKNGYCVQPRKVNLDINEDLQWPPNFLSEVWDTAAQIALIAEAIQESR